MFFQYFMNNVKKYGNKTAVKDSARSLTYAELWYEVEKKRVAAVKKGINEKTKVLLAMNNSCDWITNFMSLAILGAKVLMISPETKESIVKDLICKLDISYVITKENNEDFFNMSCEDDILKEKEYEFPPNDCEIVYHFTSGSTGEFKICIRTVEELTAEGLMFNDRLNMKKDDVILCPLPIYHSYAFGAVVISGLMTGCEIVLMERFTPRSYLKKLVLNKADLSVAVPAMARMLVNLNEQVDLSFMRHLVIGAGIVTSDIFLRFKEKFNISLSSNYGSSETGGIMTRIDELSYPSVGKPMKDVIVQIRTEDGELLKPNCEGLMWIKAPSIMNRYFNKADVFDKNGYFFTGDIAKVNKEGYIYITGRTKNIVNIGGKKVNPVYVENIIKLYKGVKETVVLGDRRSTGEEYLGAVITGDEEIQLDDIRKFLEEKLEGYMIPSLIKIVDSIPKNNMGKINKKTIIDLLKK